MYDVVKAIIFWEIAIISIFIRYSIYKFFQKIRLFKKLFVPLRTRKVRGWITNFFNKY